ncbi:MAG: Asp-tRNA(Asn)/Glu-tRNA(Gln) amidotransferase subunit GatA [Dethiobacteria bacterium]|nr:Asp-tRNA(Asn)/Glu-tRNA(Gln) amidotransferase subunit GatA [Bacillota bacterium]MDW7728387.1 Asp-tRNA(Asn)/Glu-tRNA(Gln) amidotransferase subunit GatA [Bacillota bacterium]
MKLYEKTAGDLSRLLQNKEVSAVEVVSDFLDRIEAVEPYLKAFITHTPALALETAREVDQRRVMGETLHPLAGVPVAVKDNICTENIRTTCASKILENYIPPYSATVITALQKAGMPILGKTNMDEFAMGSSTENSAFFVTHNPWDTSRVPGGSSGGSAVAVSAGMAPLALGSDTGGSVRQPASFCGVIGLRPTYGRVSRYGLIAFASSLDQIGPFALTAEDCAMLMSVISGHDPLDSTSISEDVPAYFDEFDYKPEGLRVGIIKENVSDHFDPEIKAAVLSLVAKLEEDGAVVEEVSLPLTDYGLGAYYLIAPSEASSNLGRYDGVRYGYNAGGDDIENMFSNTRGAGFGAEVKRRIMIGTYALSAGYYDAYYLKAMQVRTMIRRDYEKAFKRHDLLVGATSPTTAFKIGEKTDDPLQMYLSDICNITDALAGLPSLSIPSGIHSEGVPMGMQLTASPFREKLLLQVADYLEKRGLSLGRRPDLDFPEGGFC